MKALLAATALALLAIATHAKEQDPDKREKKDERRAEVLERKCAREADKDERRHRHHHRRDGKWDRLCAAPAPEPPPIEPPPVVQPPDATQLPPAPLPPSPSPTQPPALPPALPPSLP